jgi:4-diphosphocytidyl-2-C-methyl-D-erythritol kinase
MICFPNAKINLGLNVIERRPDGFHNIETLFYPVKLTDVLEILPSTRFHFEVSGIIPEATTEQNLVVRAFRLMQSVYRLPEVKIYLHKTIPMGAGLGGGSSDAACMLKMVNSFFRIGLKQMQLEEYASGLGADCSFFIANRPAFATGKGDRMKPVQTDLSGFSIVIVKPPVSVNTSMAYQAIRPHHPDKPLSGIIKQPVEEWYGTLVNDFEEAVFPLFPEIASIKEKLYDLGACYASMSGSGSAVYGLFSRLPENIKSEFPPSFFIYS